MKILHTSDWHIGRQFHNVSLLEDQEYVLKQIIEYLEQESVDVLLIAGDIYDRSIPPAAAVALLDDVLDQICTEMEIPVILIPGNHDSADRLGFGSRQLKQAGLHILSELNQITAPVVIKHGTETVNFYGIPYNDPEHVRDCFDEEVTNHDESHAFLVDLIEKGLDRKQANILISHCFIDGGDESESERPLSIGGADRVSPAYLESFDYVALGHLHRPQYKGNEYIRYSGSILKYSFSEEKHNKGATLLEVERNTIKGFTHLPLKPIRDMRIVEGEIVKIIEQGKTDPNSEDYLLVRLTDEHAILNAMGKLREVYPNILHLEKPGIMSEGENQTLSCEKLKRSEFEMFQDFFNQVSDRDLTDDQNAALRETLEELHQSEGGV